MRRLVGPDAQHVEELEEHERVERERARVADVAVALDQPARQPASSSASVPAAITTDATPMPTTCAA